MAKRRTSVRKREREIEKRQREVKKSQKAAEKRERRLGRDQQASSAPSEGADVATGQDEVDPRNGTETIERCIAEQPTSPKA